MENYIDVTIIVILTCEKSLNYLGRNDEKIRKKKNNKLMFRMKYMKFV